MELKKLKTSKNIFKRTYYYPFSLPFSFPAGFFSKKNCFIACVILNRSPTVHQPFPQVFVRWHLSQVLGDTALALLRIASKGLRVGRDRDRCLGYILPPTYGHLFLLTWSKKPYKIGRKNAKWDLSGVKHSSPPYKLRSYK